MAVEDLEKAVAKLPPEQLARFSAWFEAFEAARFDARIADDARKGKLDQLAEKARKDFREGRTRDL